MINKETIYDLYYNKQMSLLDIDKLYGKSIAQYAMNKYKFKTRPRTEATYVWRKRNPITLTRELHDFIVGNVLGDGGVYATTSGKYAPRTANYIHSDKHKDMTLFISNILTNFGIKQCGNIGEYQHKKLNNATYYQYRSKCYSELLQFREKMYKDGKKTIPHDLIFTSKIVLYWFLGDGSLTYPSHGGNPYIRICAEGFKNEDVDFAVDQFTTLGMKCSRCVDNTIRFSSTVTELFMGFIGKCPIEIEHIYGYKFINNIN